jgi:VWFA-related protein
MIPNHKRITALSVAIVMLATLSFAQEPTFRSQSNVVLVPALVKGENGKIVYGLDAKDFILEDNGVEQSVQMDEAAEAQPVSLIVLIQIGRRADHELPRMKGLASMLDPILALEQNEAAIITFDSGFHLVQDFTNNSDTIERTLQRLQPGDGGAAILDGLKYSANLLSKLPKDRQRVILLISETRDHGSHMSNVEDVVRTIGDSNIVVYSLAFSPGLSNILDTGRGSNQDEMAPGPDLLAPFVLAANAMRKNVSKTVAAMTGGEYSLFTSRKNFETYVNSFDNHLHSRYLLSFAPKDPKPGLHDIRVHLRQPLPAVVLSRSSYYAEATNP